MARAKRVSAVSDLHERIRSLSPEELARWQERLAPGARARAAERSIPRRGNHGPCPLSFLQERLWLLDQLEPGSAAYNRPLALRLTGLLDESALRQALRTIIDRHEILRTRFTNQGGQPAQVISPTLALDLRIIDLSALDPTEREPRARDLATVEALRPFDLSKDPVFRATLLRLGEQDHILLLVFHHIAFDAWSARVFLGELATLYSALTTGGSPALAQLPIQYSDFAHWQRQRVSGELLERQMGYWKSQLRGSTPLDLPTDRPRAMVHTRWGACTEIFLPEPHARSLKALGKRENCTLFMVLLAAFQVLLGRYTGSEDIVVASTAAGRNWIETEELIGLFLNTFLLRTALSGNPTFRELLGRMQRTCLEAYSHQDLPFEQLREILTPERGVGVAPFFQVAINFENLPKERTAIPGLRVEEFKFGVPVTPYDLALEIFPRGRELGCCFVYNADLFDQGKIERMAGHYQTLIEAIVAQPDGRIAALPLLSPAERHQILVEWNRTEVEYPRDATIQELFEAQAHRRPEAVALTLGEQSLRYGELNRQANRLAHQLRGGGVGPETRVGLSVERSLEMVVGMLGILKAGGACVPLDPAYPQERLDFMLEDAGIQVLLTQKRLKSALPSCPLTVAYLDNLEDSDPGGSSDDPLFGGKPDHVAYVLYTSGSTGKPKGVEVLHRGIVRLLFGTDFARFGETEVFLQSSSISFDAATLEIWGALLHGGRCVLFPNRILDMAILRTVLKKDRITTLWLTPAMFNTVMDIAPEILSPVSQLLVGGEALSVPHICRALSLLPDTNLVNGYGPTEGSVFACCYQIPRTQSLTANSIPIGRPIANTRAYILDKNMQPVPIGVSGELFIGGDALARGYLERPEITRQKFIPDPFHTEAGARLYKTGDLCRYRADGNIEFLGRLDGMVKIRGFRVELGEVEAALLEHAGVSAAAVVMREEIPGEKRLVAYVVPHQSAHAPTWKVLRDFLKNKLPDYMVPSDYVIVEAFPLTPSGKIDRRALPIVTPSHHSENRYVPPRDMQETQLAMIWEEILNVRPIGIEHDFFDLGGDSLRAVRMMNRIEDAYGISLPLATLFAKATIKHLAECLRTEGLREVHSAIVPVQPEGSRPPFFFLHGDLMGGLYCRKLARLIGEEQPFYSVMPNGFDGRPLLPTIEAMAEENIRELVDLQPQGPYLLGGYCNGGHIAYEMARQMEQQGLRVGLVILLDAGVPLHFAWLKALVHTAGGLTRLNAATQTWAYAKLRNYLVRMRTAYHQGPRVLLMLYWQTARRKFLRLLGTPPEKLGIPAPVFEDPSQIMRYNHLGRILLDYRPQPYQGRMVLLRTQSGRNYDPMDRTAGWGKLAPQIEVYDLPGNHLTCLTEHAGVVAGHIARCLRPYPADSQQLLAHQK
jgi:aspartate racemase